MTVEKSEMAPYSRRDESPSPEDQSLMCVAPQISLAFEDKSKGETPLSEEQLLRIEVERLQDENAYLVELTTKLTEENQAMFAEYQEMERELDITKKISEEAAVSKFELRLKLDQLQDEFRLSNHKINSTSQNSRCESSNSSVTSNEGSLGGSIHRVMRRLSLKQKIEFIMEGGNNKDPFDTLSDGLENDGSFQKFAKRLSWNPLRDSDIGETHDICLENDGSLSKVVRRLSLKSHLEQMKEAASGLSLKSK